VTYTDEAPEGPGDGQQDLHSDAYWIANLRVGVEGSDWGLYAFVNNLANEYAIVQDDGFQLFINRPRVIGVNFRVGFNTPDLDVPGF
jgi:outer membrane receptor protein involved in Fe transport